MICQCINQLNTKTKEFNIGIGRSTPKKAFNTGIRRSNPKKGVFNTGTGRSNPGTGATQKGENGKSSGSPRGGKQNNPSHISTAVCQKVAIVLAERSFSIARRYTTAESRDKTRTDSYRTIALGFILVRELKAKQHALRSKNMYRAARG